MELSNKDLQKVTGGVGGGTGSPDLPQQQARLLPIEVLKLKIITP
ncbi:hypothetical protein N473_12925 [Pseudoalteromonas luteoviolacea CPMOR-1]|uniref:Bacteriocin n=1 Tax=Pseudoalteromonas luteoviolacea CPMOR-1 TaxID=1365248 RepID=A0A167LNV3_9GAMM|nr:bacteriocin [Pseudoalteromonas luteoviolacea]KZN64935.1 hypothetical protein N473_12925 [Pseudoalteromonas luteoviolacea CPMOR-1]